MGLKTKTGNWLNQVTPILTFPHQGGRNLAPSPLIGRGLG
jgi:hypothetical protein